jgi:hypothetical protein
MQQLHTGMDQHQPSIGCQPYILDPVAADMDRNTMTVTSSMTYELVQSQPRGSAPAVAANAAADAWIASGSVTGSPSYASVQQWCSAGNAAHMH